MASHENTATGFKLEEITATGESGPTFVEVFANRIGLRDKTMTAGEVEMVVVVGVNDDGSGRR